MYMTRPAVQEQDEAFLYELYRTSREEEVSGWGWSESDKHAFLHMQFRMQQRSYELQYPSHETRIILVADQPVGRIMSAALADALHLIDITLMPAFRNQGIGSSQIRSLQRRAEMERVPLRLSVLHGNPARSLYERLGFHAKESDGMYVRMEYVSIQE
jgi:ribosomal protein S18 acetylase RimI-like enzyme